MTARGQEAAVCSLGGSAEEGEGGQGANAWRRHLGLIKGVGMWSGRQQERAQLPSQLVFTNQTPCGAPTHPDPGHGAR